ncbi:ATP-binding protein [Streptococcus suis]|uniref:ATP-binding protein n=2 Tax=Streptococcus suis TaxID=1307 RepID=UPI000CF3AED0|nr:ATP-binding protein [Streptococcus suis]MCO8175586.1 ATP-binding protein [Streptococcus suis]MCO8209975.1 ATP-binding protein [Streptococcus suis]QZS51496.1 ATP-binding protein [Streptococcus suis]HEM3427823.1 ATP-binding protein [Streptococcus suis]HEM3450356.1 ATP-binding protein [Streptococcus suis]
MTNIQDYLREAIGNVQNVDTQKVIVNVQKEEFLNKLKINDLAILSGNNADEKLIGIVTKVSKKSIEFDETDGSSPIEYSYNFCSITLVGTFYSKISPTKNNIFKRAVNTYPEINSLVYLADADALSLIMNSLVGDLPSDQDLKIGRYASNQSVASILDGNKFFQRHAAIVGSTGSGKSFTVANILEKTDKLEYSNLIIFDLHGEYNELTYAKQIKISDSEHDLQIPLWFFNYEEIHSLFIESSEGTSSNQRAVVIKHILEKKKDYIINNTEDFSSDIVTVDTPVPFSAKGLKEYLEVENVKEEGTGEIFKSGERKGQEKTKQGQYFGKLTNLITRLQTKMDDKKYGFVFNEQQTQKSDYLNKFISEIMGRDRRIKVIDLSEVPSDMLSIVIGIVTRLVYDVQFWMTPRKDETRHPLAFICDEAHLYMPRDTTKLKAVERKSLEIFEKISKEGRKYGVSLVVVSQRPAELNTTIISQCNNIISLKITNDRDKAAVATMLTDSLVGLVESLPNLDVGECIVIGDAIKLPTKILLDRPQEEPKSSTIDFWDRWFDGQKTVFNIENSIVNMIKQSR